MMMMMQHNNNNKLKVVVFFCGVIHVVTAMHVLLYVMANTLRVYLLMSRSSAQPEDLASTHR